MNVNQGTVGSDPVILATAGYDHTVRFWQAHSGICTRTVQHQDSVSFCVRKKKKARFKLCNWTQAELIALPAFRHKINNLSLSNF